jgi:hypothetical protein
MLDNPQLTHAIEHSPLRNRTKTKWPGVYLGPFRVDCF